MNFRSLYNFWNFLKRINPVNDLTASAWRQHDVSESTARSRSNLTCGVHTSVTQDLIPVKPNADWGLTRGGAHSQWPRGLVSVSLVANDSATSLATGVRPAATRNAAEVHRGCATGGGWTREGHQKVARTRPHLAGCTRGRVVAGDDGGEHFRGGRSSGANGGEATAH